MQNLKVIGSFESDTDFECEKPRESHLDAFQSDRQRLGLTESIE